MKSTLLIIVVSIVLSCAGGNFPPTFSHIENPLFIVEDTPVGMNVTRVEATDPDDDEVVFDIVGDATVLAEGPLLRIVNDGHKTATVFLNSRLNAVTTGRYHVHYSVTDSTNPPIRRRVDLIVRETYNRAPTFVNAPYLIRLSDDTPVNSTVYNIRATDVNTIGSWGFVTYRFAERVDEFHVDTLSGRVQLSSALDYFTQRHYHLTVVAEDGGGLNTTANLTVSVINSAGQPPVFLNAHYYATVFENAAVGSGVVRVTAVDVGPAAPVSISYSIVTGDAGMFAINSSSGELYVDDVVDREHASLRPTRGVLQIIVKAQLTVANAKGVFPSAQVLVTVTVRDVNDAKPKFSQSTYSTTVSDSVLPGTLLSMDSVISVTDLDEGDGGKFQIYLQKNGTALDIFDVVTSEAGNCESTIVFLRVNNASLINSRLSQTLVFDIVASEYLTSERYSSVAQVSVRIVSVGQPAPHFPFTSYLAVIGENPSRGTAVANITVSNADQFVYVHYWLLGRHSRLFNVDAVSGAVTVAVDADIDTSLLDRESADVVDVVVMASDARNHSSATQLVIRLADVNDNRPVFSPAQPYIGVVAENSLVFSLPVTVVATDADLLPDHTSTVYRIVDGDPQGNFSVNATTGLISVAAPLDCEAIPASWNATFRLTVMAVDMEQRALYDTTTVAVHVHDVNDNAPVFSKQTYSAVVYSNSTPGTLVIGVSASDYDASWPNNAVTYVIESGSRDDFVIDALTGLVTVSSAARLGLALTRSLRYRLTVAAVDAGHPPLKAVCHVDIDVVHVAGGPPVIETPDGLTLVTSVAEDAPVGHVIYTFVAVNPSGADRLTFHWLNESDYIRGYDVRGQLVTDDSYLKSLLSLDRSTGSVSVGRSLSRDVVHRLSVVVVAENVVTGQSSTATLIVFIDSGRQRAPVFLPVTRHAAVTSQAVDSLRLTAAVWRPGDVVAVVAAIDIDRPTTPVTYDVIHDTMTSRAFDISQSGVVTLASNTSVLTSLLSGARRVNVTVEASTSDSFGRTLTSSRVLTLELVETVWSTGLAWQCVGDQEATVTENSSRRTSVARLAASARSSLDGAVVKYDIVSGDAQHVFSINSLTGEVVTTGRPVDRETVSRYTLTVSACLIAEGAADRCTANISKSLSVSVLDINDNSPRFSQPSYSTTLYGDERPGTRVIKLTAVDDDASRLNSVITYRLVSVDLDTVDGSMFAVDALSGWVSVARSLTDVDGQVLLTVDADDLGQPVRSSTTSVHINVHSHRPRITSPPFNATIFVHQDIAVGAFVMWVQAVVTHPNSTIQYKLVTMTPGFSIDRHSGIVTTSAALSRSTTYTVTVGVYTVTDSSLSDQRTFDVVTRRDNVTSAQFDYTQPYELSVVDGVSLVQLATFTAASSLLTPAVCYYIVGASEAMYVTWFSLNKTSGQLELTHAVYLSTVSSIDLVIKVTDDCWSGYWEMTSSRRLVTWSPRDSSLLLVRVSVVMATRFAMTSLYAGVVPQAQAGHVVLQLTDYVTQAWPGSLSFNIVPPFWFSDELISDAFVVGDGDGVVRTNMYLRQSWTGRMFQFSVAVRDRGSDVTGHVANVTLHVLTPTQTVTLVCDATPDVVGDRRDSMTSFLSDVTSAAVGVDLIRDCETRQTCVLIHAINTTTGQPLSADQLIATLRQRFAESTDAFRNYSLLQFLRTVQLDQSHTMSSSLSTLEKVLMIVLVLVGAVLLVMSVVFVVVYIRTSQTNQRKLKAASALTAGYTVGNVDYSHTEMTQPVIERDFSINPMWLDRLPDVDSFPTDLTADTDSGRNSSSEDNAGSASASTQSTAAAARDAADTRNGHDAAAAAAQTRACASKSPVAASIASSIHGDNSHPSSQPSSSSAAAGTRCGDNVSRDWSVSRPYSVNSVYRPTSSSTAARSYDNSSSRLADYTFPHVYSTDV